MKTLTPSLLMSEETDMEQFDDGAFVVYRTRWDTYASRDKEGNSICSSVDKDACVYWTREHLNGFKTSESWVTNISVTSDSLK